MNIAILNAYHRYRFLPPHHKHRHDGMFNVLIDSLLEQKTEDLKLLTQHYCITTFRILMLTLRCQQLLKTVILHMN